ncbi:MAG: chitobiase/beta-hexosaminidase C-terminal domain-containing protein [Bacteroidales bacterium]|nr:chitobiase/beta-hexosaminidase C-terminal domain-containing protein [Bacteroidales bacterium]
METKRMLFFVVCLILGLNINAQDNYLRVTDLSQIQNGSSIIFAARHDSLSTTSYYLMSNVASGKPQGTEFNSSIMGNDEVISTEIVDDEFNYCWTVGIVNGNYTFVNPNGDMIGYGSSGTDFVKNGANSTWSIVAAVSGTGTSVPNHNAFLVTNVGASNRSFAFRKYNSGEVYEKFAPYSNSSANMGGTTYFFYIDIFVKSSEVQPVVSLPKFSPEGGDYTSAQNVTISCDTQGATIYYTSDGSTPTNESNIYVAPIEVSSSIVVKAIAVKDNMIDSDVATATYNIIETAVVSFYENGSLLETKIVTKGNEIGEMPVATSPDGFSFIGWTENEIEDAVAQYPSIITESFIINEDKNFYAVFSVCGNNCIEAEVSSFNPNDVVVLSISKEGKYYAMSQIKGSNGQPTANEISVVDGKIIGAVSDDIKWNIAYNNGDMIIYPNENAENWLYCNSGSNNNSVRIGTNADNNIFELKTVEINGELYPNYLYNKSTERFVGVYYDEGNAVDWRAYKLTASGAFPANIKNQTYHFFKYEGVNSYCTNIGIPSAQIITTNTTWNNVSIMNKVIVDNNATLTVNGILACTNADNLIVKDGSQLVHNSKGVLATLEKVIEGYEATDGAWYTISSPIVGNVNVSAIEGLMPTTNNYDLYRYDEPSSIWQNVKDANNEFTTLDSGRGYLYANENDCILSFAGQLNSEDVSCYLNKTDDISLSGFNLIGNPFPHNIYIGAGAAIDDADLADGYYTLSNSGAWGAKISEKTPIAPCQSVLVKTTKAGELKIKKTNSVSSRKSVDAEIIAVNVSNNNHEDVAYISFNGRVGLEKINHQNDNIPMIYIPVDDKNYAIAMLDATVKDIPISFVTKTMGEYTISVSSKLQQFDNIYLVDKLTGDITNMLLDDYTFIATSNDNVERFELKLYNYNSIDEINNNDDFVYVHNNELIINEVSKKAIVQIFDMMGREVLRLDNCVNEKMCVSTDIFKTGIYIVRKLDNKQTQVQKITVHK